MAIALGKRKRRTLPVHKNTVSEPEDEEEVLDAFRRAFEARFEPLNVPPKTKALPPTTDKTSQHENDDEASDWSGIESEDGSDKNSEPEIVEHRKVKIPGTAEQLSNADLRTFMSSKPPSLVPKPVATAKRRKKDEDGVDSGDETANLKNDLKLQRLLSESHLLDSTNNSDTLTASGRNRHAATDMRLRSLGAKTSILTQEKMPLAHRKGIVKKAEEREGKRRSEARASGIVLERERRRGGVEMPKRERAVGGPTVGRFKAGTLRLTERDVKEIQGDGGGGGRRGMGKRRR